MDIRELWIDFLIEHNPLFNATEHSVVYELQSNMLKKDSVPSIIPCKFKVIII